MDMEALVMVLILIVGLTVLGLASLRWGADSRPAVPDDHTR
jgi:hypothetical protein